MTIIIDNKMDAPSCPIFRNEKLGKSYKLCSQKKISELFKEGTKAYKFPFSSNFQTDKAKKTPPFQIVVAVPKRNFKKAHDRNRLKRKIREAVRKNKLNLETFLLGENLHLSIFLLYSAKEELNYEELSAKTKHFFSFLQEKIKHEKLHP